jgi:DNA primase (bacterial type)
MGAQRIDFKELRMRLSFPEVLAHYKAEGKAKGGEQWQGYCPLPSHVHNGDGGKPRSPSFSVNFTRGIYNCFGCGGKGNVLEFVIRMEGFDPNSGEQFRRGALRAEELFIGGRGTSEGTRKSSPSQPKATATRQSVPAKEEPELPIVENSPLDFVLQGLDAAHPYLAGRGFTPEIIEMFGLGYCSRGLMKGRVAIPLHNTEGQLIGYAGRIIDDALIDDDNPKYRFPGDRVKDGKQFVFRKSAFLYNGNAIDGHSLTKRHIDLVLVEGFPSVWWLTQHGITNVVATMGASISKEQAAILVAQLNEEDRVWILPDGDAAGERLATEALTRLAPHCFVRLVQLQAGQQPTDLNGDDLDGLFPFIGDR